jgi:hypothetical protein
MITCDWCGRFFEIHSDVKHILPTNYYSIFTYVDDDGDIVRYYICDECTTNILESKP